MLPLPLAFGLLLGAPASGSQFDPSVPWTRVSAPASPTVLPSGNQCAIVALSNPSPGDLSQDGIVALSGSELAAVLGPLQGVDFRNVALAAGPRGPLPDVTDSVFREGGLDLLPLRRIDLDGDGVFDPGDRIEFFAHGPSFWEPHPAWPDSLLELNVHPWDLDRRYLVRLDAPVGSPEMPVVSRTGAHPAHASTLRPVWAGKHLQLRSEDTLVSGREWFWTMSGRTGLSPGVLAHPATRDLPGLVGSTATAVIRLPLEGPGSTDSFRVVGARSRLLDVSGHQAAWSLSGVRATGNEYEWHLSFPRTLRFESYTIQYRQAPSLAMTFPTPTIGTFQIPVGGSRSSDTLVAVEYGIAKRIIPLQDGILKDSASTRDTWYVPLRGKEPPHQLVAWKPPSDKQVAPPEEFSRSFDRDLVVVAPDSFLEVASQFAKFRADPKRNRPFSTIILRAEDVWLMHGNGSRDPLALRAAIAQAKARWGSSHAMLLGGGHVDSRGILRTGIPPIPLWTKEGRATDAILQYLDPGESQGIGSKQDIALGRIPARSRREAEHWFEKVQTFEDPGKAKTGLWRNTFLATADDLQLRKGAGTVEEPFFQEEYGHTRTSERILDAILAVRPWLNVRKVYLVQFPANGQLEKPEAQTALVDELGRGVVAFNYMGHGASDILADERLLDTRSAITRLRNSGTPFLFFAGSCTVGRHDMIVDRGLSEALVVADRLGAFAAVSGTRLSSGLYNDALTRVFWTTLLRSSPTGVPTTLGEAFLQAGNTTNRDNSDIYNLLGDPSMAPFPAGSPMTLDAAPRSLAAHDTIRLTGQAHAKVRFTLQTRPTRQLGVYVHRSSEYTDTSAALRRKIGERTYVQEFQAPGKTLLSVSDAADGTYSTLLRVPTRIPFGDTASLSIYAWDPATLRDSGTIAHGIPLSGVSDRSSDDRTGPAIRVLPCDSSWSGGHPFGRRAEVPSPFCLNIAFEDSSGISTSDAPDEGIVLSIPGTLDPWHPQDVVEGLEFSQVWTRLVLDPETFKAGRTYPLQVFARDLMGNASSATVDLHIRPAGEIDLYEVFNRPNPVKGDATIFHFKLLGDADSNGTVPQTIQASIRIHTLSGKLVRVLRTDLGEVGQPRPRAVWDLRDSFLNEVANGLYPYVVRLRVKDPEGGNWREIERRGVVAVSR